MAEARRKRIRRILKERGLVAVDELCLELSASGATVRRDLAALDQLGQVRRVHGGAVAVEGKLDEPGFDDKASIAAREKQAIAETAFKLVKRGDSIYLDGGSTVLALARLLADMTKLTVVTNSLRVVGTLAGSGPRMIVIGGRLRRLSQTFVGPLTRPLIEQLHFDKAFMGTIGFSTGAGLTTTDADEALTKRLVMTRATQVLLLADSSKLGKVAFANAGGIEDIDVLVTDSRPGRADMKLFAKNTVKVVTT